VLANIGDQRRIVVRIDVGDVIEAERRELGIRAMIVAAQRGFEAIERAMQIAQRLPSRPTRIDALGLAIPLLASIPSVAPPLLRLVPRLRIFVTVAVAVAGLRPTASRRALAHSCAATISVGQTGNRPIQLATACRRADVCRTHELSQRLTQLSLVRWLLEERIGTEVEHIGEVTQRSAKSTVENHGDRRTRPSPTQPRQQHVGVEIGDAREDRRGRGAGPHATIEIARCTQRNTVATRRDQVGELPASGRIADDQNLRRHAAGAYQSVAKAVAGRPCHLVFAPYSGLGLHA
jgi:hypothetical protein